MQNTTMEHAIISNKWLSPSKLLATPLEGKLSQNDLQLRWLVGVPLLPERSRGLTDIALALLRSAKSAATKKHRTSYPQDAIPTSCKGSPARLK
jgi:hypothetical protein